MQLTKAMVKASGVLEVSWKGGQGSRKMGRDVTEGGGQEGGGGILASGVRLIYSRNTVKARTRDRAF